MTDRWTAEEYRRYLETGNEPGRRRLPEERVQPRPGGSLDALREYNEQQEAAEDAPAKAKYRNEKVAEDGITFDSRHEHRVYQWLKARKERGELRWIFVHVPFRFMSGVTYWADFMTIRADGMVEAVWDAKSKPTADNRVYINKKKQLRAEWGIEINEVTRRDYDGRGGFYNSRWNLP